MRLRVQSMEPSQRTAPRHLRAAREAVARQRVGSAQLDAPSPLVPPRRNSTVCYHRIAVEAIPQPALAFALDLMGEDKATLYVARYYGAQVSIRRAA